MRARALAIFLGLGLLTSPVAAEPFSEGDLALNPPSGWTVQRRNMPNGTALLAFTPSSDCWFFGIPNAGTAGASVAAARGTITPLTAGAWASAAQVAPDFFSGTPSVLSSSVDTSGFWPVQRATFEGTNGTVHGVIQVRPGAELRGFCMGPNASYDAILNTLGHPNDATWEAQGQ